MTPITVLSAANKTASCVLCCDKGDSPLSIAASISGLLTFIYGVAVGIFLVYSDSRAAEGVLLEAKRLARLHDTEFKETLEILLQMADVVSEKYGDDTKNEHVLLKTELEEAREKVTKLEELVSTIDQKSEKLSIVGQIKYIVKKGEVKGLVQIIEYKRKYIDLSKKKTYPL
jgi:hypothetical protein